MVDDLFIKTQKRKAQELKKSRWWQNKISNNPYCYYCGKALKKNEITMDHIVPLSEGGKSTKSNIVIACKECNIKKKDTNFVDWFKDKIK